MAESGGGDFHQHFARARRIEFEGFDAERLRFRVGLRLLRTIEHGGADFHACLHEMVGRDLPNKHITAAGSRSGYILPK